MARTADNRPVVLTIAGFDPTGAAGTLADIRTIEALGCRTAAAISSLTFQNSTNVFGAVHQSGESLRAQVSAITEELRIAAVKTGMLPTEEVVIEVGRLIHEMDLPAPVVDPVLRSTSGAALMDAAAIHALKHDLLPRARVITPNIPEAETLTELSIQNEADMRRAAKHLRALGARAVLIKGGHLICEESETRAAIDVLDDDGEVTTFKGEWFHVQNVRGTGCMLSSAIAAGLARGKSLRESVSAARDFVRSAISAAASV